MLDTEELLHLAANAGSSGNTHAALMHLDELLQREPRHAKALYLRGVQHALIGLFDRGITEMTAALSIDPGLEYARFQLTLLLLVRDRSVDARQHLSVLHASADAALSLYSQAVTALIDGDSAAVCERLEQGLKLPAANPVIVEMMKRLREAFGDSVRLGAYQQT